MTVPAIEQRYLNVSPQQKLDALARILETEPTEAVLIFTRTKNGAAELSERLQGRGYAAEAMHGDMNQAQRESVIRRLKSGQVEIVVATDVAARGLDVERISHVVNFDMPNDVEAYVHRIGRTGRAGRSGVAVLFVSPRERRMMTEIERYTGQRITPMKMPTQADVAARRVALFKDSIRRSVGEGDLDLYLSLVEELVEEGLDLAEIAAGAARLAQGDKPLTVEVEPEPARMARAEDGMVRLFIDAGSRAGVRPGTSWERSPTRRGSPARRSARSTSMTASPSSSCRRSTGTRCWRGWPAPPSAAARWASGWRKAPSPGSSGIRGAAGGGDGPRGTGPGRPIGTGGGRGEGGWLAYNPVRR